MANWATLADARVYWADAVAMPDAQLTGYLTASTEQCVEYAPATIPDPIPQRYILACIYQAKEIHSASLRDGDVIGFGDYAIRARPLTAQVKQLIRPISKPVLG